MFKDYKELSMMGRQTQKTALLGETLNRFRNNNNKKTLQQNKKKSNYTNKEKNTRQKYVKTTIHTGHCHERERERVSE